MNMFNNQGQINASNMKDAFQIILKYASILEENMPSSATLAGQPSMNDTKRNELITKALLTNEGKIALAQAMANPIRRNLDYQGIARRTLVVDPLPQGVQPSYDRDIDVAAVVVSSNGSPPESRIFSERTVVDEFEVVSNPTVRMHEVRKRRFNIVDRAVQKARQEIMAQEDGNIFSAIDVGAQVENTLQDIADAGLQKRDLVRLKKQIDRWDLVTTKFFLNIDEFTDILNWGSGGGQAAGIGGEFDPVTMREVLQTGLHGKIWGADILVSKIVPPGTVYACADPEFVGVMPIRQDIEVIPADEPRRLLLGWIVSEVIGIGILNPRGVSAGRKSVAVG